MLQSQLSRLVYAGHARGTHNKLALDALNLIDHPHGAKFAALMLAYHEDFLTGTKAPDKEFKDFQNHVLHVRGTEWGGAPAKAAAWYGHLLDALRSGDWKLAAYSAGVLTHYATDVWMPLHTAQSDAEAEVHRAAEWSASCSYDTLWAEANPQCATMRETLMDAIEADIGQHSTTVWVERLVRVSARCSNAHYERVIAHYDLKRGVVTPEDGYDQTGRKIIANMLAGAAASCGLLFEQAVAEARVDLPTVSGRRALLRAVLALPLRWWQKRLNNAADRREVEAIYDELQATGRVDATLSEELRVVKDAMAKAGIDGSTTLRKPASTFAAPRTSNRPSPARQESASAVVVPTVATEPSPTFNQEPTERPDVVAPSAPTLESRDLRSEVHDRRNLPRLAHEDDIEAAPSIGEKTAARLARIGITTVADFLETDPGEMARDLSVSWIPASVIIDWQDQALLMCTLPRLSATGAKLLVGAGYRDIGALGTVPAETLVTDIAAFAGSPEGQRISGAQAAIPTLTATERWIAAAQDLLSEEAA